MGWPTQAQLAFSFNYYYTRPDARLYMQELKLGAYEMLIASDSRRQPLWKAVQSARVQHFWSPKDLPGRAGPARPGASTGRGSIERSVSLAVPVMACPCGGHRPRALPALSLVVVVVASAPASLRSTLAHRAPSRQQIRVLRAELRQRLTRPLDRGFPVFLLEG